LLQTKAYITCYKKVVTLTAHNQYRNKWWALAAVGSGVLLSTIDGSIVNIALNTFVDVFQASLSAVEWVLLSYLLTITCLLLSMGRLGDMLGQRRIYLIGFVVFTIASALCGLAPTIGWLIGFRVLQAVGAAMIQAVGPALLVTAFPPQERGTALGWIGSFVAVGILTGPILGGILIQNVGWESIFYVNIPVGVVGIWLTLRALPKDAPAARGQRFDYLGALLLLLSLLGLLLGLTEGPVWGWGSPAIIGLFVLFVAAGALFFWWERRAPDPMVRLGIFSNRAFSFSLLAALILFVALAFNLLLTPIFLQRVAGFDQQTTGLVLIALPLVLSLASPLSGRLSDRIGPRMLTVIGLLCTAVGLAGLSAVRTETPLWYLIGCLMLTGLGIGLFQSPNNSVIMGHAPREALGVASGLLAVVRTLGQTGGIAIAGAIWASQVFAALGERIDPVTNAPREALATGFDRAMLVAAGIALLAIVPTLVSGRAVTASASNERPTEPVTH
jgi:EmrB/QacA subfamily drug resistance transporter